MLSKDFDEKYQERKRNIDRWIGEHGPTKDLLNDYVSLFTYEEWAQITADEIATMETYLPTSKNPNDEDYYRGLCVGLRKQKEEMDKLLSRMERMTKGER